jgi:hypothetical protein
MSAHGFKSVFMVGAIASAALGCYLVSLRVASERAALESVENKIVLAQRDIRLLNTEIGTRGRLAQLERWNVKVIRLSAPSADQFVESSFQLATLVKPESKPAIEAPLVYAAAPAPVRREPVVTSDDGRAESVAAEARPLSDMMHVASYSKPAKPTRIEPKPDAKAAAPAVKAADKLVPGPARPAARLASATAKPVEKPAARPKPAAAAKAVKTATADPLGPLPGAKPKAKSGATGGGHAIRPAPTTKESGSH